MATANYSKMTPVHVTEMRMLKTTDRDTWNALEAGDFVAVHSQVPFTNLFNDQSLEQQIKKLKMHGGMTGLTQDDVALDRLLVVTPHLAALAESFLKQYPRNKASTPGRTEHYQLTGGMAVRVYTNAVKIRQWVEVHCKGNVYVNKLQLKSISSSSWIPEDAKDDILNFDIKGLEGQTAFIKERMLIDSPKSIWDPQKKLKVKSFSTWMKKSKVNVGDKVIKIREERQLMGRMLVIQEHRPELVPPLETTIKKYEMSVIARMFSANDGSLYIPTDKSSLMNAINNIDLGENVLDSDNTGVPLLFSTEDDIPVLSESENTEDTNYASSTHSDNSDSDVSDMYDIDSDFSDSFIEPFTGFTDSDIPSSDSDDPEPHLREEPCLKVKIIDAMAILRGMKKKPTTKKFTNFSKDFVDKIDGLLKGFDEGRIMFDPYNEDYVLKDQTHEKRATPGNPEGFDVYMDMPMTMSIRELLSTSSTKRQVSKLLAKDLLKHYEDTETKIIVAYQNTIESSDSFEEHSHDEADTLIPNQVIDCAKSHPTAHMEVESPDTDVMLLLMHVVASGHLNVSNTLILVTGKGKKTKKVDIVERVCAVGPNKAKGLLGFHNFTGGDWGRKYVGISKKTWADHYLALEDDCDIVNAFCKLEEELITGGL